MTRIHPTAIVDPKAQLDATVEVGPYAIIESGVTIGAGTIIGPHAWIRTGTTLGARNHIHYGAILGHWPQDVSFAGAESFVWLGDENQIREYVTIHRGTKPGTTTTIGHKCFLMAVAHVAHNCQIGNEVIIANNTALGGYVTVEDQAFISALCVVHQFARIGRLAMLSGMTGLGQDIPPFFMSAMRNQVVGVNTVGLRRAGIAAAARLEIKRAFKLLYQSGLSVPNALTEIQQTCVSPEIQHLVTFIQGSKRGLAPYLMGRDKSRDDSELEISTDSA